MNISSSTSPRWAGIYLCGSYSHVDPRHMPRESRSLCREHAIVLDRGVTCAPADQESGEATAAGGAGSEVVQEERGGVVHVVPRVKVQIRGS